MWERLRTLKAMLVFSLISNPVIYRFLSEHESRDIP